MSQSPDRQRHRRRSNGSRVEGRCKNSNAVSKTKQHARGGRNRSFPPWEKHFVGASRSERGKENYQIVHQCLRRSLSRTGRAGVLKNNKRRERK